MKTLQERGRPFPNGLGFDLRTKAGHWDFWRPDLSRTVWVANYIPRGGGYATRSGRGETPEAARAAAVPVNLDLSRRGGRMDDLIKALRECLFIMSYYHKSEPGHLDSCEMPENCGHCLAVGAAQRAIEAAGVRS